MRAHEVSEVVARAAASAAPSPSLPAGPAAAAPTAAPSHPSSSQPSHAPSPHQQVQDGVAHVHKDASQSHGRPTPVSAPAKQRLADSLLRLFQAHNKAPPRPANNLAASSITLDTACHCLIVDDARLTRGSADSEQLAAALALAGDRKGLREHIKQWILDKHALPAEELCVAYVSTRQPRRCISTSSPMPA